MTHQVGFLANIKMLAKKNIKSSAALGLITVTDTSTPALIDSGRVLLRCWLQLNGSGFGFGMLSAASIPVFDLHCEHLTPHASKEFEAFFKQGKHDLKKWFQTAKNELPLMVFRTGLSGPQEKKARTLRRDIDDVLKIR